MMIRCGERLNESSLREASYRQIRADPPFVKARTCSTVGMVVSPLKVMSNVLCTQPN